MMIPTLVQPENEVCEHIRCFTQERLERCSNCGSSLWRNYNEDVPEGDYYHQICAVCNQRLGAIQHTYKKELHFFDNDVHYPFMCVEIKIDDIESFEFDIHSNEPAAQQFINHLEQLGYDVETLTPNNIHNKNCLIQYKNWNRFID
jgi:hypothetical protein